MKTLGPFSANRLASFIGIKPQPPGHHRRRDLIQRQIVRERVRSQ
jgi:hypothetical protein